jgi:RNA polymerase sigma factor (sigma-70 family)
VGFVEEMPGLAALAYRVAYRLLGDRHDAEDVAQETMARALVRWSRVEEYAPAWVAKVAANLAIGQLRRARLVVAPPAAEDPNGVERTELVRVLRAIPRRQREVVVLRYLLDLSEAEVAERLACRSER